jgi:hypothetical protein
MDIRGDKIIYRLVQEFEGLKPLLRYRANYRIIYPPI